METNYTNLWSNVRVGLFTKFRKRFSKPLGLSCLIFLLFVSGQTANAQSQCVAGNSTSTSVLNVAPNVLVGQSMTVPCTGTLSLATIRIPTYNPGSTFVGTLSLFAGATIAGTPILSQQVVLPINQNRDAVLNLALAQPPVTVLAGSVFTLAFSSVQLPWSVALATNNPYAGGNLFNSSANPVSQPTNDCIFSLTVTPCIPKYSNTVVSACGSYVWNNKTYNGSTIDSIIIRNGASNGCDSIARLILTINPNPTVKISPREPVICNGGSVTLKALCGVSGTLSGSQQVPPVSTSAGGLVRGAFNSATNELSLDILFAGLSAGGVVGAHIHNAAFGSNGGVIIDLVSAGIIPAGVTSGNFSGVVTLTAPQAVELLAGRLYINIHTAANPSGQIRAQLFTVCNATSFAWSPAGGLSSTTLKEVVASPDTTRKYVVTATNANGCIGKDSVIVRVRNSTFSVTTKTECGSFTFNGQTYTQSGNYSKLFPGGNAQGCDSIAYLVLTINPLPVVSFNTLAPIYNIAAAAVTLTGSPAGGTFSGPGVSGNTFTPSVAGAGGPFTITYAYTDSITGCRNTASQQVTVATCKVAGTPGVITTVGGAEAVCPGATKTYSIAAVAGATSYTWTAPTGANITAGQGTTSVTVNYTAGFTASGFLRVVANNACGFSAARSLTITRNTALTPGVVTGSTYGVCNSAGKAYSVVNVPGRTYNWTFNTATATVATGQGTNAITANFNAGYVTGTLSVTAATSCNTSAPRVITIRATPPAPVAVTGANAVCANQAGVPYSIASVPGATTYTWTAPSGSKVSDGVNTSVSNALTTAATAVTVKFGIVGGNLYVKGNNSCGAGLTKSYPITMNCFAKEGKGILPVESAGPLSVSISPNPSNSLFTLTTRSNSTQPLHIRVSDVMGRIVYQTKGQAEQTFRFGDKLSEGLYLIEVRQGDEVKMIKAVKGK